MNVLKNYYCDKCKKLIQKDETIWKLIGIGNYDSHFDGEKLHKHFCDECLNNFINGGEADE